MQTFRSLAFLAAVGLVASVSGARAEEPSGLSARAEVSFTTVRNLDLDYAFVDDGTVSSGGGELSSLGFDREAMPRLTVGWTFDRPGRPTVVASFWQLDIESAADTGLLPGRVGALLASPDFAVGRSLVDRAEADAQIRATVTDLGLEWRFRPGEAMRLDFGLGARIFRFEHSTSAIYSRDAFGVPESEFVTSSTDASGIGPRVWGRFGYRFGRVELSGHAQVAVPFGEREALSTDTAVLGGAVDRFTQAVEPGRDEAFVQLGTGVEVSIQLGRRVELWVGYDAELWSDVASELRFVDDVSQNTTVPVSREAVFEGPSLGLSISF